MMGIKTTKEIKRLRRHVDCHSFACHENKVFCKECTLIKTWVDIDKYLPGLNKIIEEDKLVNLFGYYDPAEIIDEAIKDKIREMQNELSQR